MLGSSKRAFQFFRELTCGFTHLVITPGRLDRHKFLPDLTDFQTDDALEATTNRHIAFVTRLQRRCITIRRQVPSRPWTVASKEPMTWSELTHDDPSESFGPRSLLTITMPPGRTSRRRSRQTRADSSVRSDCHFPRSKSIFGFQ